MLTLFFILALMPVLVFIELTAQRWLFKNDAQKHDQSSVRDKCTDGKNTSPILLFGFSRQMN